MQYADSEKLESRLARIEARRRKLAHGAVYSVNHDGLIIAKPRRRRRVRIRLRTIFLIISAVILFKAVVYASIGQVSYNDRVALLAQGTLAERVAAWFMSADGATVWLADQLRLLKP